VWSICVPVGASSTTSSSLPSFPFPLLRRTSVRESGHTCGGERREREDDDGYGVFLSRVWVWVWRAVRASPPIDRQFQNRCSSFSFWPFWRLNFCARAGPHDCHAAGPRAAVFLCVRLLVPVECSWRPSNLFTLSLYPIQQRPSSFYWLR
jgi:hypothetical protein